MGGVGGVRRLRRCSSAAMRIGEVLVLCCCFLLLKLHAAAAVESAAAGPQQVVEIDAVGPRGAGDEKKPSFAPGTGDAQHGANADEQLAQDPVRSLLGSPSSQRGSGEKYGKLLSKVHDFAHLPEGHPARLHADSRSARKRSIHLVLMGFILAIIYFLSYFYQSYGAGLRTHLDRHSMALGRLGSASSAMLWVVAWRLWLGLVVGGLVSLALSVYQLNLAINKKKNPIPKWVFDAWTLLIGVPLLIVLLLTGSVVKQATVESGAAFTPNSGFIGTVLAHSQAASRYFFLDAIQQVPFGLVVIGLIYLFGLIIKRLKGVQASQGKKPVRLKRSGSLALDDESSRTNTVTSFGYMAEGDVQEEADSRRHGSYGTKKRSKRDKTRTSRRLNGPHADVEPHNEGDDPVTPQSSVRTRRADRQTTRERRRSRRAAEGTLDARHVKDLAARMEAAVAAENKAGNEQDEAQTAPVQVDRGTQTDDVDLAAPVEKTNWGQGMADSPVDSGQENVKDKQTAPKGEKAEGKAEGTEGKAAGTEGQAAPAGGKAPAAEGKAATVAGKAAPAGEGRAAPAEGRPAPPERKASSGERKVSLVEGKSTPPERKPAPPERKAHPVAFAFPTGGSKAPAAVGVPPRQTGTEQRADERAKPAEEGGGVVGESFPRQGKWGGSSFGDLMQRR